LKINYLELKKFFKHIVSGILFLAFLISGKSAFAQVTITEADLSNLCVDGGFYTLPDIIISESNTGDFNTTGGISNYRIELPPNFEFNTADFGDVFTTFGGDINVSSTVTDNINFIQLNLQIDGTTELKIGRASCWVRV